MEFGAPYPVLKTILVTPDEMIVFQVLEYEMLVGVVEPVRPIPTHLSAELLTTHVVPDPAATSVTAVSATPPSVAATRAVGELVVDSLPSCP